MTGVFRFCSREPDQHHQHLPHVQQQKQQQHQHQTESVNFGERDGGHRFPLQSKAVFVLCRRYAMKCLDKKRIKMKGGETLALNERIMLSSVSTGVSTHALKY